ncbi:histone deacetylase [Naegleria gruberi]|uniref:histone deacetylase n=1 Tax=Naegleria gruberi TaxID=5762 RepID=D2W428_NAEGR|nr:histone deacetylase [Naegleria gruberi]EFC36189.1 histone deacetylase [Naegleria gruberi]|eukprot:XP_002668933.1 histone deacetylase [Naegleria gruberi strain NEG-M]
MSRRQRPQTRTTNPIAAAGLNMEDVPEFLEGCTFFVDPLTHEEAEAELYREIIKKLGGQVVTMYKSNITHLMASVQRGENFYRALEEKKTIVTSFWLDDCMLVHGVQPLVITEKFGRKIQNPLHYPVKDYPITDMEGFNFTLSGFPKKEKTRLQYLIAAMGSKYSSNMTQENTHLLYKVAAGAKYDTSIKWGIKRVDKNWLYDCARDWKLAPYPFVEENNSKKSSDPEGSNSLDSSSKKRKLEDNDGSLESIIASNTKKNIFVNLDSSDQLKTYCDRVVIGKNNSKVLLVENNPTAQNEDEKIVDMDSFLNGRQNTLEFVEKNKHLITIIDSDKLNNLTTEKSSIVLGPIELSTQNQSLNEKYQPKKTGLLYDARMCLHDGPIPETPVRISHIWNMIQEHNLLDECEIMKSREVTQQELALVHTEKYIDDFFEFKGQFNPTTSNHNLLRGIVQDNEHDIQINQFSLKAARLAAGGVIKLTEKVLNGELENGMAIVRPPGHHAQTEDPMGFCFFNNAAVAARVAQQFKSVGRVAIIDFDIHHGNGTQEIFEDDPSILYVSIHRFEQNYFPGTGSLEEVGIGKGEGYTLNIPLPPKDYKIPSTATFGDSDYIAIFRQLIIPVCTEFAPDLVIVSAGFDAAKGDILGRRMSLTPSGYEHIIGMLKQLAGGKIVLALEGGYKTDVTASCATASLRSLLNLPPSPISIKPPSKATNVAIRQVIIQHAQYWKCLKSFAEVFLNGDETPYGPLKSIRKHPRYVTVASNTASKPPSDESTPMIESNESEQEIVVEQKTSMDNIFVVDYTGKGDFSSITEALNHIVNMKQTPVPISNSDNSNSFKQKITIQVRMGLYSNEKIRINTKMNHKLIHIIGEESEKQAHILYPIITLGEAGSIMLEAGSNIIFENIFFKATKEAKSADVVVTPQQNGGNPKSQGLHIRLDDGAECEIRNCKFSRFSTIATRNSSLKIVNSEFRESEGIACEIRSSQAFIHNSKFVMNENAIVAEKSQLKITNNLITGSKKKSLLMIQSTGTVQENEIIRNESSGIQLFKECKDVKITKNVIMGQKAAGIVVNAQCKATLMHNQIFDNTMAGIEVSNECNIDIIENEIYKGGICGILIATKSRGTVEKNRIYENAYAGLELRNSNPTIRNNQIYSNRQSGVSIKGKDIDNTLIFQGNEILSNVYSGIEIRQGATPSIVGNRIFGCAKQGIIVVEQSNPIIEKNEITENSDGIIVQKAYATIKENKIINNSNMGVKVRQFEADIIDNEISANGSFAIYGDECDRLTISKNKISAHKSVDDPIKIETNCKNSTPSNDNLILN